MQRAAGSALLLSAVVVAAGFAALGREGNNREYITAPVERGVIATAVEATGRVESVSMVDVSSQLSGRIAKVFVDFNDSVKAGQPLAELDRGIFIAHVNEAQAAVSVAKRVVNLPSIKRVGSVMVDHIELKIPCCSIAYGCKAHRPIYRGVSRVVHYHQSAELDWRTIFDCSA